MSAKKDFIAAVIAGLAVLAFIITTTALDVLRSKFGKAVENDGTTTTHFGNGYEYRFTNLQREWKLGSTRISAVCIGSGRYENNVLKSSHDLLFVIEFADLSRSKDLAPKFALSCVSSYKIVTGNTISAPKSFVMWIDIYNSNALNDSLEFLSDSKSFEATPGEIKFTMTRKNLTNEYTINRINGNLAGLISENGKIVARESGSCEKVDLAKKKF